jgi:hypothetical protein
MGGTVAVPCPGPATRMPRADGHGRCCAALMSKPDLPDGDLREVYRQLKRGAGREYVDDGNVDELISLAEEDDNAALAQQLREWRSPCTVHDGAMPSTIAPTPGFNRENAKH